MRDFEDQKPKRKFPFGFLFLSLSFIIFVYIMSSDPSEEDCQKIVNDVIAGEKTIDAQWFSDNCSQYSLSLDELDQQPKNPDFDIDINT